MCKGKKVYIFGSGHITNNAAMHIYMVKSLKNLLQNHGAYCLETLYVAFGDLVLETLCK